MYVIDYPPDVDRLQHLEAEILEVARLLALRGKRSSLAAEIRKLASEHLRIQLEQSIGCEVLIIDGPHFGRRGTLLGIERFVASVQIGEHLVKLPCVLLRSSTNE